MDTLFYFHDPMCSWCWGYRPVWIELQGLLPPSLAVECIVGGLAPDSDEPMPTQMVAAIQSHWRRIYTELGTRFNHDFWVKCQPRRSTYPACRAVIAAKKQDKQQEMILAIQEAYYLRAMNPSDISTLTDIAKEQGLDVGLFEQTLQAPLTEQTLKKQVQQAKEWQVPGFPSLVLSRGEMRYSIEVNYKDANATFAEINRYLNRD